MFLFNVQATADRAIQNCQISPVGFQPYFLQDKAKIAYIKNI
jgi:hypothetical protein